MKISIIFLFITFTSLFANSIKPIEIDSQSTNIEILSHSYYFIDSNNTLSKKDIEKMPFKPIYKSSIRLGVVPNSALWIKFVLKNKTSKKLTKIIEYQNPKTEDIYLYDGDKTYKEGMFHMREDRYSINPIFKIELKPYEKRVYYIKSHSKISTLIAKLKLWNEIDFIRYDYKHKICIFVFFTIIFTLLIYNFILHLFTKDSIYLYYIFYLLSIIIVQSIHLGIAQLYLFSNEVTKIVINASVIYISILVISSILFVINFLHTKRYPKIDKLFKIYLYLTPVIAILSYDNFIFNLKILVIYFPLGFLMIFTGIYALKQGIQEAKIYLAGWSLVIITLLFSVLKTLGVYDITEDFTYINEFAFIVEAFVFSIALAYRINILSEYKRTVDKKLIKLQQEEKENLKRVVDKQTRDLKDALEEKDILYKELNHRVKNNLQMILSLMKLQINSSKNQETIEDLTVTKDRINSITKLYEILYTTQSDKFSTKKYFEYITKNITDNYNQNILIDYKINHEIDINHLVYCGLILNELITNSIKYAFTQNIKNPTISIEVYKKNTLVYMIIKDNGMGLNEQKRDSLGLTIVRTLTKMQLHGSIDFVSENGLKVIIKWREKSESMPLG